MARRSSVEKDPRVREAVDDALKRGCTLDEIVEALRAIGSDVSRSAVGRYAKQYSALAARQRDMQAVARSFASEFGSADDQQGRLLIQLVTTLITSAVMPAAIADGDSDGEALSTKSLADLARAVKDVTSASKVDIDREHKIREEEAKRAKREAAEAADHAGRAAGASEETLRKIRMGILGLSS
ncbi:hypothetical protein HY78_00350 [Rhizorhabdus wittichii DC-6]|nr:hypothetical protein HY78_00350 [Rhizorhabdus wittichii DC-6]